LNYWQKCFEPRESEVLDGSFAGELVVQCATATVGQVAFDLLAGQHEGNVIGTASSGLYVNVNHSILFVSFEKFRSPLTVSLMNNPLPLHSPALGMPVRIECGRLFLPSVQTCIWARENALWRCPSPAGHAVAISERLARLEHMVEAMVAAKGDLGFTPLLYPLIGRGASSCINASMTSILESLRRLIGLLKKREIPTIVAVLTRFMGRGRGLTPSGDDLIVGLLLVLNRWPGRLCSRADLAEIDRLLVRAADEKTTTLAAHLIKCAARGESDERLVNAVDCLFTNAPQIDECIAQLKSWGGSSGADSLAGMTAAVMPEAELSSASHSLEE
jgi:hypothetical protein